MSTPPRDGKPYRDKETLQNLFSDRGLNTSEIADELGCGRRTVTNWLYRLGIKEPSGDKPYHDEQNLRELYVGDGKSCDEIAERWDCSDLTIRRWLTRHGVTRQGINSQKPWTDEDRLRKLYCGLGLTTKEVGDLLGCSDNCINEWLMEFGIERKLPKWREWTEIEKIRNNDLEAVQLAEELDIEADIIESQHARYEDEVAQRREPSQNPKFEGNQPWHSRDRLLELYKSKGMSATEIAEEHGVEESTINRWLRVFSLKPDDGRPWTDKKLLEELYLDEDLNAQQISDQLGCAHTTILEWLDKFGISKDEKPPLWQIEGVLRTLYVEEEWSAKEISDELGCDSSTISVWLRRHDVVDDETALESYKDKDVLYRLYKKKKLSVTDIADELGCSHGTICYWLAKHEIETRTHDEIKHSSFGAELGSEEPFKNQNLLESLYVNDDLSISQVAAELGCSAGPVRIYIDKYDIEKNGSEFSLDELDYEIPSENPWRDKELMKLLYVEYEVTTDKIAELLECGQGTVSTWLQKHSIDTRWTYDRPSKTELKKLYIDKEISGEKIGNRLGVSTSTIFRWLRDYDIEIRSVSDYSPNELDDPSKMKGMYVERGMTMSAIANELGVSSRTVRESLDQHDIETRPQGVEISGEKSPFWKGAQEPYGKGWTEQKRQAVLKECDHLCQSCGLTNEEHHEEYEQSLHIHHVRPASTFDDPEERNAIQNLVALCSSCHKRWEGIPLKPSFHLD